MRPTGERDGTAAWGLRARPYLLDDATVARAIQVHRDQADDLDLFQRHRR
jgi:hypothetical protein